MTKKDSKNSSVLSKRIIKRMLIVLLLLLTIMFIAMEFLLYFSLQLGLTEFEVLPSPLFEFVRHIIQSFFSRQLAFYGILIYSFWCIFSVMILAGDKLITLSELIYVKLGYGDVLAISQREDITGKLEKSLSLKNLVLIFLSIPVLLLLCQPIIQHFGLQVLALLVLPVAILISFYYFKASLETLLKLGSIRQTERWKVENLSFLSMATASAYGVVVLAVFIILMQFFVPLLHGAFFGSFRPELIDFAEDLYIKNPQIAQNFTYDDTVLLITNLCEDLDSYILQIVPEGIYFFLMMIPVLLLMVVVMYGVLTWSLRKPRWFFSALVYFSVGFSFSFFISLLLGKAGDIYLALPIALTIAVASSISVKTFKILSERWFAVICSRCGKPNPVHYKHCPVCGEKTNTGEFVRAHKPKKE